MVRKTVASERGSSSTSSYSEFGFIMALNYCSQMIISWSLQAPETVAVKKNEGENINYVCVLVILKDSLC